MFSPGESVDFVTSAFSHEAPFRRISGRSREIIKIDISDIRRFDRSDSLNASLRAACNFRRFLSGSSVLSLVAQRLGLSGPQDQLSGKTKPLSDVKQN